MAENTQAFNFESKKLLSNDQFECAVRLEAAEGMPIKRVISVKALPKIMSSEKTQETLSFSGRTSYCVVYEAEDGRLKSIYADAEWQGKTTLNSDVYFLETSAYENTITGTSSAEVTISTLINVDVYAICGDKVACVEVSNGDYVTCEKTHEYQRLVNSLSGTFNLLNEDEFKGKVDDVVCSSADVVLDNAFAGIDTVTLEGRVYVQCYLNEEGRIHQINKVIDFKQEMAALSAAVNNNVDAKAFVSALRVTASVSDIDQKSNIIISVEVGYNAAVYAVETINVIEDAFSLTKNINTSRECALLEIFEGQSLKEDSVGGSFEAESDEERVCFVNSLSLSVTDIVEDGGNVNLSGWIEAEVVCEDNSNEKSIVKGQIPFVTTLVAKKDDIFNYSVRLLEARLHGQREIELKTSISICHRSYKSEFVSVVTAIEEVEDKVQNSSGIRVYIVKENEDLFSVAKSINMRPEDIAEQNPSVNEGINAGDRLVVYFPLQIDFN